MSWHLMADIEPYSPHREMPLWQHNKLMASYGGLKMWTQVITDQMNPDFQAGSHRGVALLLPMHLLFESEVERGLKSSLPNCAVTGQARRHWLATHDVGREHGPEHWFSLRPDLLIENGESIAVLDAKWKLIDQRGSGSDRKYDLSQSDFYQLFAYGHKYLGGQGNLCLIYPGYEHFTRPLPPFDLDTALRLWVIPYDMDSKGLVAGEWCEELPMLAPAAVLPPENSQVAVA